MFVATVLFAKSSTTQLSVLVRPDPSVILRLDVPSLRQGVPPMAIAVQELAFPVCARKPARRTTIAVAVNPASRDVVASNAQRITSAQLANSVELEAAPPDARPTLIAPSNRLVLTDSVKILVKSARVVEDRNAESQITVQFAFVPTATLEIRLSVARRMNVNGTLIATWTNAVKTTAASCRVLNPVLAESTPSVVLLPTRLSVFAHPVTSATPKSIANKVCLIVSHLFELDDDFLQFLQMSTNV
jgi:hypothetical protein